MAHASQIGAFGLDLEGGGKEMIDAPMLKQVSSFSNFNVTINRDYLSQAEQTIQIAKAAGIEIPDIT